MLYRIHFSGDIRKLYHQTMYVSLDSPQGLLNKVLFETILYFCRRGRENICKLDSSVFVSSSFVVPWWFFVCSDFTFVIYFLPSASYLISKSLESSSRMNTYTGTPDIVYNIYALSNSFFR
jgi:hypothetical protein